ncbi:hypothetical protein F5148DRAFT_1151216 [Russula earlei]|uniref:Uncharacterized protein n=1 Tax=Russula earlei TaxID=71964 RepID=A0ACC0U285_9AGAM|nr:hypothetical protein F5148DRAFT_1151216 [Russula earlei]
MSSLAGKFKQLKLYPQALLEVLPLVDIADQDVKVNRLLMFSINKEWVQDVGEEGTQGKGIEELVTVLKYWVTKLPGSAILQSWLKSSIDSTEKCILKYSGKLLDIQVNDAPGPSRTALPKRSGPTRLSDHLNGSTVASTHKSVCKDHKKPDTKALHDTEASDYITDDKSDDGHTKEGRRYSYCSLGFQGHAMPLLICRRK